LVVRASAMLCILEIVVAILYPLIFICVTHRLPQELSGNGLAMVYARG
jgi:fucose permease